MNRRDMLKGGLGAATAASLAALHHNWARANASDEATETPEFVRERVNTTMTAGLSIEPSRRVRVPGFDYEHEVRVALPRSYGLSDAKYPVLWVTDGSIMFEAAASTMGFIGGSDAPEVIVVAIGTPTDAPMQDFVHQRTNDFLPKAKLFDENDPGGRIIHRHLAALGVDPNMAGGGAPRFLDFLIDELRPILAREYRFSDDHCLFGHSFGGTFVGFSIFARPGGFSKYICGSPAMWGGEKSIFQMEADYAASHDDLPISVFFGAGDAEIGETVMAAYPLVGSMVRLSELMKIRRYPSLEIFNKIFTDESHGSVVPQILNWDVRMLWADSFTPPDMEAYVDQLMSSGG